MGGALQKRLMLVLTVDVNQHLTQGLHVPESRRGTVDKALRATIVTDHASQ